MEEPPSDLKTILHSKRVNLYYLEIAGCWSIPGRAVTDEGKESLYWNIRDIANTTCILLGTGTSIISAMRELAKAGVLVGFVAGHPLLLPRGGGQP